MNIVHVKEKRRDYSLEINAEGNLYVKTPMSFTQQDVQKILHKHRLWISRRENASQNIANYKKKFVHGETLQLVGRSFVIEVMRTSRMRSKVYFKDRTIVVELASSKKEDPEKLMTYFLKKTSLDMFIEKTAMFASLYGFEFNAITIKSQKTKWGSCSSKKNLNFNWKLIFAPEKVLDYVVIHEVCHLKEMNHSKNFWELVKLQCPDYKNYRLWLRTNGHTL